MKQIRTRLVLLIGILFLFTGCEQLANFFSGDLPIDSGCSIPSMTKHVQLPGVKVKVKVRGWGETPCIVFASAKMYPRVISHELYDDFTFYFVDARWFGEVTDSSKILDFNIDTVAQDIDMVRQELGLEEVAVMGHSIHGSYAMEYARRYPDNCSHVIVLGGAPTGVVEVFGMSPAHWEANADSVRKQAMADNMAELAAMDMTGIAPHEQFILKYVYEAPQYWKDPFYDCSWIWEDIHINMEMVDQVYALFAFFDPTGIEVPIYSAVGMYDFAIPYPLWEQAEAAGKFSNLTVGYYQNSGHYPMFEEACLFNEKITAWIDAN